MGIDLYCGINEIKWNYHPVAPGPLACVSPVYGASIRTKTENAVKLPENVSVIQDSGAFCDGPSQRLDFHSALTRQTLHSHKYEYASKVTHRASYDLLIDEVWVNGNRYKRRWSVLEADRAVEETIAAARYLSVGEHRQELGLVLSAQGVDSTQYLDCVKEIVPLMDLGRDILGLGGWCIVGKQPKIMMPVFERTILKVIPYAAHKGVKWVHIWGVIYASALGKLLWMCNQYGIKLSTDSAGPSWRPAFGQWGYGDWRDNNYKRVPTKHRGIERTKHVELTRRWLNELEKTKYYREPKREPIQLTFEEGDF